MSAEPRYEAFISYSHEDRAWAKWLLKALETYRVPSRLVGKPSPRGPVPDRLKPLFCDREELSAAGELGATLTQAIAESGALIVICSPKAAASRWVNEEALAFKRVHGEGRVFCAIVGGHPAGNDIDTCFPPSLRFRLGADGQPSDTPVEPLAADFRDQGDGRRLGKLKLIAGLLEIRLDSLIQREAARRQRRLVAVTALALAVMLVTSFLAVQAVIAERAAERRQKQAENLVNFMLGDLTDKLQQVSRLDILEAVDDKAMTYFASLPEADVTDQALMQRAKALQKIGNVRLDQGHLSQALASYVAAAALTGKLAIKQPANLERQLAHGDNLTYVGTAHWYQGELAEAETSFESAQALLNKAKLLNPEDATLLFELANIDNNIGHVLEGRGRLDDALLQYRDMLKTSILLAAINPDNAEWAATLGLAHNNLAKMALLHGNLANSIAEYRADVAIESDLARRDEKNNAQAEKLVLAQGALGRTLGLSGNLDQGIATLQLALDGAVHLSEVDPQSTVFQEDVALYSSQLARLSRLNGDLAGAAALTSRSLAIFRAMTRKDPDNSAWQRELAEARIEQAEEARAANHDDDAQRALHDALTALEPLLEQQAQDRSTVLATNSARLLLAAITDDTAAATSLREKARASLEAQSSGLADPRLQSLRTEATSPTTQQPTGAKNAHQ